MTANPNIQLDTDALLTANVQGLFFHILDGKSASYEVPAALLDHATHFCKEMTTSNSAPLVMIHNGIANIDETAPFMIPEGMNTTELASNALMKMIGNLQAATQTESGRAELEYFAKSDPRHPIDDLRSAVSFFDRSLAQAARELTTPNVHAAQDATHQGTAATTRGAGSVLQ